jgi:hypothetical protein
MSILIFPVVVNETYILNLAWWQDPLSSVKENGRKINILQNKGGPYLSGGYDDVYQLFS